MYIVNNDEFCFIHIQKTGGTWVKYILERCYDCRIVVHKHAPIRFLPQPMDTFCIVRNPYDWYCSSWSFTRGLRHHTLNADDYVKWILSHQPPMNKAADPPINGCPPLGAYSVYHINATCHRGKELAESGSSEGYTQDIDMILQFENLTNDLIKYLPKEHHSSVHEEKRKNGSGKHDWRTDLSQKTRDMIYKSDKLMFELYGYDR